MARFLQFKAVDYIFPEWDVVSAYFILEIKFRHLILNVNY